MRLQMLAKASDSKIERCPAVYVAQEDSTVMVVQGKLLDAQTTGELRDLLADESAVRIPAETVIRAVERYLAEHGPAG